ncbi:hypothetical protein B0T18DRAFT_227552 [Schizothecium vesticola]|uniref:Uncharacterized protein n=1 Tax=Schizothecium vesticola TaxID=314040 RepID=A0AA40EKX3_9PEZI|nr:hypothetical protein B0T18DRAFT_227552 [Schizothecium vesticola]
MLNAEEGRLLVLGFQCREQEVFMDVSLECREGPAERRSIAKSVIKTVQDDNTTQSNNHNTKFPQSVRPRLLDAKDATTLLTSPPSVFRYPNGIKQRNKQPNPETPLPQNTARPKNGYGYKLKDATENQTSQPPKPNPTQPLTVTLTVSDGKRERRRKKTTNLPDMTMCGVLPQKARKRKRTAQITKHQAKPQTAPRAQLGDAAARMRPDDDARDIYHPQHHHLSTTQDSRNHLEDVVPFHAHV